MGLTISILRVGPCRRLTAGENQASPESRKPCLLHKDCKLPPGHRDCSCDMLLDRGRAEVMKYISL